jgi:hypothetical protein
MGHVWRERSVRGVDWDGCDPPSGGMLEPLAGEEGGEGTGGGLDAAEGGLVGDPDFHSDGVRGEDRAGDVTGRGRRRDPPGPRRFARAFGGKTVHWTVFCSASPFDDCDWVPAMPDLFADKGSGGLIVAAIRRPSLSKTEWMVTTDGEVDHRKLVRGAGVGVAVGRGPELGGQPVADLVMGAWGLVIGAGPWRSRRYHPGHACANRT